jgi:translocation and assembly module TamA
MRFWAFILISFFFFSGLTAQAGDFHICDNINLEDGKLKLNNNEKTLICGSGSGPEAWVSIPIPQAELHLKSILQNLGYLNPRFERQGERLRVWQGERNTITALKVEGAEGTLNPGKKRKIIGAPLMPEKLNEVEAWGNLGIRSQGYACPEFKVEAHAWDGSVLAKARIGAPKKITVFEPGDLDGLNPDLLDRYRPFELGDTFDIRKTQILTSRLLSDGLFQSAYFVTDCVQDEAHLKLQTSVGKPKILRFGVGASTEQFPFADLSFKNARLDAVASSFTVTLHGSPIVQSLQVTSELYVFPGWHRTFAGPRFRAARDDESGITSETVTAGADLGRNWDQAGTRFQARGGPTLNQSKTLKGFGPEDVTYTSLEASLTAMSHLYEVFTRDQYEGWSSGLFYRGQRKGVGSNVSVNRVELDSKYLWNIGGYAPPLFVLGAKLNAITVDADDVNEPENRNLLPREYRIALGGDENLRGFPRRSLNNQELGYLTSVYLGLELRLIEELPYHLQPFLIYDSARLGNRRFTVDDPIFISEGAGLRWPSPFGTLRMSAARGRIFHGDATTAEYVERWIYFLSFGQEF